jgi:hypothetical protein
MPRKYALWFCAAALVTVLTIFRHTLFSTEKHWETSYTIQLFLPDIEFFGSYVPVARTDVITFLRTSETLKQFPPTKDGHQDDFLFIAFPTKQRLFVTCVVGARTKETSSEIAMSLVNACLANPRFKNKIRLVDGPWTVEKN